MWDFVNLTLEMSMQLFFFPFSSFSYFCSFDVCAVCIVSGGCNQSYPVLIYVVFKSLFRCIDAILNSGKSFSSFFLTHTVCLRHLWVVKSYASSRVFLFSGLFVEVLPLSTSRIVPSILREGQPWDSSLWRNFCHIVWFWVVFSFSWNTL